MFEQSSVSGKAIFVKKIQTGLLSFTTTLIFLSGFVFGETPPAPDVIFAAIPGGSFRMGDESGDLWKSCSPVHDVTVADFRMSETEITNAQYCIFLNSAWALKAITISKSVVSGRKGNYRGKNFIHLSDTFESSFPGNRCRIIFTPEMKFQPMPGYEKWPVVCVTWYGAKVFAEYYGWDIPREAEWEYACRGGRQYAFGTCDGTNGARVANCVDAVFLHPVDVGSYSPNPFGLYDMTGNVWEWCDDWYGLYKPEPQNNPTGAGKGIWRIMRGGGWSDGKDLFCRSAARYYRAPNVRSTALGFRIVKR
jgi:formylglycine-generating enzyme